MKSIIAADLGGTKLRIGKVEGSSVRQQVERPVPSTDREELVLQEFIDAIRNIFDSDVEAIGIGVPSVVDVVKGIVYSVQNIPSWKEVHLKEILEKEFHVPVYVNNDANCFALGECHFGKGRGYRDIVGLTIGTGLGAGIIINRRLYNGSNCGAGEIGMIPYKGQIIEYYCSGQFFTRECGMSGQAVYERALSGDAAAVKAYESFGREMAFGIVTALYAYDPEIIIFGGSVSKAFSLFRKSMMETVASLFAYSHALERLVIETSGLSDTALMGAAALHLDALEKLPDESAF
jgi:glucokinase